MASDIESKNIFPKVIAPSMEISNENSVVIKNTLTSEKLNLHTFGNFENRMVGGEQSLTDD